MDTFDNRINNNLANAINVLHNYCVERDECLGCPFGELDDGAIYCGLSTEPFKWILTKTVQYDFSHHNKLIKGIEDE